MILYSLMYSLKGGFMISVTCLLIGVISFLSVYLGVNFAKSYLEESIAVFGGALVFYSNAQFFLAYTFLVR